MELSEVIWDIADRMGSETGWGGAGCSFQKGGRACLAVQRLDSGRDQAMPEITVILQERGRGKRRLEQELSLNLQRIK